MKKRIEWVDLSKFVGIFAMVWGHSGVNENMDIIIHAFHMPLFFFLSGYFYKDGGIKMIILARQSHLSDKVRAIVPMVQSRLDFA